MTQTSGTQQSRPAPAREGVIGTGIVGLGRSGWNIHAEAIAAFAERFRVAAVTDESVERRAEAEKRFGCQTYTGLEELLADPEVELVIVATPSHLHARHTILALQAGKHVLCEKPMALSLAEVDGMMAVAEQSNRLLSAFHNRRFDPHFLKIKEIVASGVLGRIVQVRLAIHHFARRWDWQTLTKYGGGVLNNVGPHFIDQVLYFLPADEQLRVDCHMDRALTVGDAEDHCVIQMRASSGPLVQLEMTSACAAPQDNWLIMGTQGTLHGSFAQLKWRTTSFADLPVRVADDAPVADRTYNRETLHWQEHQWDVPADQTTTRWTHRPFYRNLFDAIRNGAQPTVLPGEVRRLMQVIDAARQDAGASAR